MIDFDKLNQAVGLKPNLTNLGTIISTVIPYLFGAAGLLLLLYLVWGGFSYMLSGGDPKGTESAKQKITNALVGFTIVFVAYWLVQILGTILGIRQFQEVFR
jgi:hypothetical protein